MNAKLRQVNIKKFSFTAVLFIGLLSLVGLQGCADSSTETTDTDTPPPITTDQNASGLFTGHNPKQRSPNHGFTRLCA